MSSRRARVALRIGAALSISTMPATARADLGPHFPSGCEGKVAGESCKSGGAEGKCIERTVGARRRTLVCAPPLDPSAYPPVADPFASSSAPPGSAGPAPAPSAAPSASSAPPSGSKGCGCVLGADGTPGEALAAIAASVVAVGATLVARRRRRDD